MSNFKYLLGAAGLLLGVWLTGCDNDSRNESHNTKTDAVQVVTPPPGAAPVSEVGGEVPVPQYAGRQACAACHTEAMAQWKGSHHDLAMQVADASTVLGDFSNTTFKYNNITSIFYRDQDQFRVRTDGPDGRLHDYTIKYTFGVEPLQQYLIEFEDGRVQALGIAWDSRSKAKGGQRWFHLYPAEQVDFKHRLHWTARDQNWNFMCAECHSTQLQKKYDSAAHRFNTTFSDINVACESCHGPGSNHVAWAQGTAPWVAKVAATKGLAIAFDERAGVQWTVDPHTGNARRSTPITSRKEINTCARCHSRRSELSEDFIHGRPIGDTHRVALLDQDLYLVDGQPNDETYVYGSFLQSKMYHNGVTCSDCHQPHSLALKAPGDQVCAQCHRADKYASAQHHFHKPDSAGASCIECHMPLNTYMVVDGRRDHSFRVPRPDLSVSLQTPNTCNQCHQDKTAQWAQDQLQKKHGHLPGGFQQYASVLDGARRGEPEVRNGLLALALDPLQPAIARASATTLLPGYPGKQTATVLTQLTLAPDPLLRRAALEALSGIEAAARVRWIGPLLNDPVRDVRVSAAHALADIQPQQLMPDVQASLQAALDEYIASQMLNADRPEAHVNLGGVYLARGNPDAAQQAYLDALNLDPAFVPAIVNLADLYRITGQDASAGKLLEDALRHLPADASLNHVYGLLLVRKKQLQEGLQHLEKAAQAEPFNSRYAYVYAVALYSAGQADAGIRALESILAKHPFDRDSLWALIAYCQERGDTGRAQQYRKRLQALEPDNQQLGQ